VSGGERYIEQYLTSIVEGGIAVIPKPDRRRMAVLTAAFAPIAAAAALPVTAAAAVLANLVANATNRWVGVAVLVVAVIGLGFVTARVAANYQDVPATHGWRRWLPLGATAVVVGVCLAEIVSGSHTPDPVIALWLASLAWVYGFLPLSGGTWNWSRRVLWTLAPVMMLATIVCIFTHGLFVLRFERSRDELDALAVQVADGGTIADGQHVGGFVVHYPSTGAIGRVPGCDVGFWITGWHEDDTRYIVHCVVRRGAEPASGFKHLAGNWWQLTDKQVPHDL
jgi:hypothetical protein